MVRTRIAWPVFAALACLGGCAQVLGLGGYGEAPDSGETGVTSTSDGGADGGLPDSAADTGTQGTSSDGAADGTIQDGAADAVEEREANASIEEGSTDAADASCVGVMACAPAAPNGWTGPLALWEGTSNPPACATGFRPAFDGGAAASSPPAQCTCTCTAPACGPVTLSFTPGGSGCSGSTCGPDGGAVSVAPGSCVPVSAITSTCGSSADVKISGSVAAGCTPNATAATPPWAWGSLAVACALPPAAPIACPAGGVCVPAPQSPFETRFCVLQAGSVACPAGAYSVQRVYFNGVSDTRQCSTCTCGGADCNTNAHVLTWSNSTCTNISPLSDFNPLPRNCATVGNQPHGVSFTTTPTGTCAPLGGQPTGSVSTQGPVTLCCTP